MRTIVWFIYFGLYLLCVWPKQIKARRMYDSGKPKEADEYVRGVVYRWASRLLRLAGADISVKGRENIPSDRPVIFVCNHRGNFDVPLVLSELDTPHALLSKTAVSKIPFISGWMKMLGCVFIDRSDPRKSLAGLAEVTKIVNNGYSYIIFPEGTRSKGGDLGDFKSGAFKVATDTRATLLPVAIEGTHNLMESNKNLIRPARVRMHILRPIETKDLSRAEMKDMPDKIRSAISDELKNMTDVH